MGADAGRDRETHERGSEAPGTHRGGGDQVSPWEWVTAAIGAVIVLGALGFMTVQAFTRDGTPPEIVIEVDSVHPSGGGHLVEFTAHNRGGTTAAALRVEGELTDGAGGRVEVSETTIDYVPANGNRQAGLMFTADPRRHTLRLRPSGYDLP